VDDRLPVAGHNERFVLPRRAIKYYSASSIAFASRPAGSAGSALDAPE